MPSPAITTLTTMLEQLPDPMQEQVLEHLREYIADLWDEAQWNEAFHHRRDAITRAARQVRSHKAAGLSEPMDMDRL